MSFELRKKHLERFYLLLGKISQVFGGPHTLDKCSGRFNWPFRGVYFFFEPGEFRSETGSGSRVVRVGTHALKAKSKTSLWNRLSQHKGQEGTGGGNHRGSIFRLIVGNALINHDGIQMPTWGQGNTANSDVREIEKPLECAVSRIIGKMPFLWVPILDEAGPNSLRGYIERNSISLLSNYQSRAVDPPSIKWLGHYCDREKVRNSGLWNSMHVNEKYDVDFLDELEKLLLV